MEIKINKKIFLSLYGENREKQLLRYRLAIGRFIKEFKREDFMIISVPGRVEIAGNHTDHQRGKVIAAAVDIDGIAVCAPRGDTLFNIMSEGYKKITVDIGDLKIYPSEQDTSSALIRGIAAAYKKNKLAVKGADVYVTSDVPVGSGLSSSAQFGVLIANIFNYLYNNGAVDAVENAKYAQYAENEYFGKPCGLMDQTACSVGGIISIDFFHKESPEVKKIPFNIAKEGYSLCVIDTGGSHVGLTDQYAAMPEEMKKVAAYFGKEVLSEVSESDFYSNAGAIKKECGDRAFIRAYHYFTETDRVGRIADALKNDEFDYFLMLEREAGRSSYMYLQNAYPTNDVTQRGMCVAYALSERLLSGSGAVRVHGGGIAGTVLAFVPQKELFQYKKAMESVFGHGSLKVLSIREYGAVRVL